LCHPDSITDRTISRVEEWLHKPSTTLQNSRQTVSVQLTAPFEKAILELGFKAIEILLASAIILGSTGAAWLGLTMASLFPTRHAAGVFASAYGQMQPSNTVERVSFRAAGTVWGPSYSVHARGWADDSRVAVGYGLQYGVLVIVQYFKLPLRSALEFDTYAH